MAQYKKTLLTVSIISLLAACGGKPDQKETIATQGLFAGTFSDDASSMLIGSIQHGASYWQLDPSERKYNWNHASEGFSEITDVAISGNKSTGATVTKNQLSIWSIHDGKNKGFWQTSSEIESLALNNSGSAALVGLENGQVWYMDTRTGKNLAEFAHSAEVHGVDLTDDHAITASDDNFVRLWDLRTKEVAHERKMNNISRYAIFSPSGKFVFVSSLRGEHLILDSASFELVSDINERYMNVTAAIFSDDESTLYLANQQGNIRAYETQTGSKTGEWVSPPKAAFAHGSSKEVVSLAIKQNTLLALSSGGELHSFTLN